MPTLYAILAAFGSLILASAGGSSRSNSSDSSSNPTDGALASEDSTPTTTNPGSQSNSGSNPISSEPRVSGDWPTKTDPDDSSTSGSGGSGSTDDSGSSSGGSGSSGGNTGPTIVNSLGEVISSRVTLIEPGGDDVAAVRIIDGPEHGNVTVNPDNSMALVMSMTDYTGDLSFTYEVTDSSGNKTIHEADLDVIQGPQTSGWGHGDFYMLQTDASGDLIVEHGDNHRDVYMSGSSDALTKADIAALEGLSENDITGQWLADHPEYGSSEGMALGADSGRALWAYLGQQSLNEPASHWLHLETGFTYDIGMDEELGRSGGYSGMWGESELHPIHITSYGDGPAPLLEDEIRSIGPGLKNVVFNGVEFTNGMQIVGGENVILEDITMSGHYITAQNFEGLTIRNSEIYDIARDEPITNADYWDAGANRISGIYTNYLEGLLIENTLFDRNGWEEGDDPNLSLSGNQPPSKFNHNIYLGEDTTDVTIRDSVIMRGASFGAQVRGGGFVEDNVFLDNNAAVFVGKGGSDYSGNYSLFSGNVTTSAGHRDAELIGFLASGMGDFGEMNTHIGNIVTHLADPNNPTEIAAKTTANHAIDDAEGAYYFDTIVYNWAAVTKAYEDLNVDGLDPDVLDQTTIQNYAADLIGSTSATIDDLANYLRAKGPELVDGKTDAELIIEYFQESFGILPDTRFTSDTLRFVPNDLGDGIRWDNRLNWSTEDLPGTISGDSVDLAGNWVTYGGSTTIRDLEFGDGGSLRATHGYLNVEGDTTSDGDGAEIDVDGSGQIWLNGYSDTEELDVDVDGGRFANTGAMDGLVDITVNDGQILLATDNARLDLFDGSKLTINGDDAKVGFEGLNNGEAVLRLNDEGTLRFAAADGRLGTIEEFRSGFNGDAANRVESGINFGEGTLELDLTGLASGAGSYTLVSTDEMVGAFSNIDVTGLGSNRDMQILFDYTNDELVVNMGATGSGSGEIGISMTGNQTDAQTNSDLWQALTNGMQPLSDQLPDRVTLDDEVQTDFL